jgi:hypothetical protein
MSTKYIVWIDEGNGCEEQGDGPLTLKQAERISREIRQECGCKATYAPANGKGKKQEAQ